MVDLAEIILLLHIISAILMVGGGIARQITRSHAAKAAEITVIYSLTQLASRFDRLLVIPGSQMVLVFGVILALMRGWPLFGFLQGAEANWLLVSVILYLAIMPLVIFLFIPHRRRVEAALAKASAQGQVTDELRALLNDPAQRAGHRAEEFLGLAVLILMVLKPF